MKAVKLTKLQCAVRQLETAVALWFESADPVSIHTLGSAALQVLHDMGKKRGAASMTFSTSNVAPGLEKEYLDLIRKPQNFFKHGNSDPRSTVNFNPKTNDYLLFDGIHTLRLLNEKPSKLLEAFNLHFGIHHPKFFPKALNKQPTINNWRKLNRQEFILKFMETG